MTRALDGTHVLGILLGVFIVVAGVNALFIIEAYTSDSGEDEQRPYLQGVEFNDTLERRALQARLGWRATIATMRTGRDGVRIAVAVADKRGSPVSYLALAAELKRPANALQDRRIALHRRPDGVYEGTAAGLPSGAWDLLVVAQNAPATPFEAGRRIWLR